MVGIVLVSHAGICQETKRAAGMIVGDVSQQFETVGLAEEDSADEFELHLRDAVRRADAGDGVVIVADLLGGTPFNRAATLVGDGVSLIYGMNLALVIQLALDRTSPSFSPSESLAEVAGSTGLYVPEAVVESDELL